MLQVRDASHRTPVGIDVVVGDVGGAAGGDDDAWVAMGRAAVRSGGGEAWGAPCERSVPGPWLRYTRFAESVAVVPTWRVGSRKEEVSVRDAWA